MAHTLNFDVHHRYSDQRSGIEIPTAFELGETVVFCQAKVDPGAQDCLFKRELGEELGLDIERGHFIKLDSLAGTLPAYGHEVTLHTLGLEFNSIVYFAADYGLRRNLLGREGWLQKVRLAVVDYDATIYLSPYDES
jgi:8-oxo-dGTP pyrophosphatase MutT (NUDIX family)